MTTKPTSPSEGAMRAASAISEAWLTFEQREHFPEWQTHIAVLIDRHLAADAGVWEAIRSMEAIIVRCVEGDKRSDWLPVISSLAREAIHALQAERGGG